MEFDRYLDLLEQRIVELLAELDGDEARRAMMGALGDAAWDSGVYPPSPNPDDLHQWAHDLISGNPAMVGLLRNKRAFEWMPLPGKFENLDEIVSAFRPTHSLD